MMTGKQGEEGMRGLILGADLRQIFRIAHHQQAM
jgi:hypothetical protein